VADKNVRARSTKVKQDISDRHSVRLKLNRGASQIIAKKTNLPRIYVELETILPTTAI
jgi:hypothetical protein